MLLDRTLKLGNEGKQIRLLHIWISEELLIQKSNFLVRLIQAGSTVCRLKYTILV